MTDLTRDQKARAAAVQAAAAFHAPESDHLAAKDIIPTAECFEDYIRRGARDEDKGSTWGFYA